LALMTWAAAAALAVPAAADEVRLRDGRVLVGPTTERGDTIEVETTDGLVVVRRDEVSTWRTDQQLRGDLEELAARAGDSAFAAVQLARTAHGFGLYPEMWAHLERALQSARRGTPAHRALHKLLAELEPVVLPRKWRDQGAEVRVRELLWRLRPGTPAAQRAAVAELLAREPDPRADAELRDRARTSGRAMQRLAAVTALYRRPAAGNDAFALRTTILDRDEAVRHAAAALARDAGLRAAEEAVRYLSAGLLHSEPEVRIRTAQAFAHLGAPLAVDVLVAAAPWAGRLAPDADVGATRGHVAFLEQTSFVRDFDVEVAQASFIADPKIDVLQSGVVLDTTVHAVVARRADILAAYRLALRKLAGSDPGSDPRAWAAWRAKLRPQAPAADG
jgi:hypothetical protein